MQKRSSSQKSANTTIRQVFDKEGQEPLTDTVIAELVARGWPEGDLREMAAEGASYSRIRDSIIYPPEFDGIDEMTNDI